MGRGGDGRGQGRKPFDGLDAEDVEAVRRDVAQWQAIAARKMAQTRNKRKVKRMGINFETRIKDKATNQIRTVNILHSVPVAERAKVTKYGLNPKLPMPESVSDEAWNAILIMRANREIIDARRRRKKINTSLNGLLLSEPIRERAWAKRGEPESRDEIYKAVARAHDITPRLVRTIMQSKKNEV